MSTASHLDFYTTHEISPVRQNIDDLHRHFQRRHALYRQLGIIPHFIEGRSIIEIGPGSGYNSLYTASLKPSRYRLVEGNPTGITHMEKLFAQHQSLMKDVEITLGRIEDYRSDQCFDLVLCEGLLSGVPNPETVLDSLTRLTAKGGVLVITCVDHLSHFPETIRRVMARRLIAEEQNLDSIVKTLLPAFSPHLATLPHASRRHDDWIVDNLIHPGSIIPLINFPEAIAVLAPWFDFFGSAPHFVSDWRWHKQITGPDFDFNLRANIAYWQHAHNLIDHRFVFAPREPERNQDLYQLCSIARRHVECHERTAKPYHFEKFMEILAEIICSIAIISPPTAQALEEALSLLERPRITARDIADMAFFTSLFGRGQQYISLTKKS